MRIKEIVLGETPNDIEPLKKAIGKILDTSDLLSTPITPRQMSQLPEIKQLLPGVSVSSALGKINYVLAKYYPNRKKARPLLPPELTQEIAKSLELRTSQGLPLTARQIAELPNVRAWMPDDDRDTAITKVENILLKKFPNREKAQVAIPVQLKDAIKLALDQDGTLTPPQLMSRPEIRSLLPSDNKTALSKLKYVLNRYFQDREMAVTRLEPQEIEQAAEQFAAGTPLTVIARKLDRDPSGIQRRLMALPDSRYLNELLPSHLNNRTQPFQASFIEVEFFNFLQDNNLIPPLERNKTFRRPGIRYSYNCDGVNEDHRIVIEFYGDRYHANPKKYPDDSMMPLSNITAGQIRAKDKLKRDYLKGLGYNVIVVWEADWLKKSTRMATINRLRQAFLLPPLSKQEFQSLGAVTRSRTR